MSTRTKGTTPSFLKRGDAAKETLQQQKEAAEARRLAAENRGLNRFYVRKLEVGRGFEEHEVVVLDDDATQAPHAFEHSIPGPGMNWSQTRTHTCVDELDNCVLCRAQEQGLGEEFGRAHYGAYITILDLTPYTIKKGQREGEVVEYTRKLMQIPQKSVPQFMKIFELAKKEHGTTRGVVMVLTKNDKQDARCGIPQMLDNGRLFDMMTEEELDDYANEAVVRDSKVVKEEGIDIEPADYEKELAPETSEVLRQLYRLPATTGSEEEQAQETGSSRRSRRRGAAAEPEQNTGGRRTRRAASTQDDQPDDPPATGRRRTRAQAQQQDHDDDQQDTDAGADEQVDSPPPRTRRQRQQAAQQEAAPPTTGGRRRRRADLDDEIPF